MSRRKKRFLMILGIVFIPFFIFKLYNLTNYKQYPGTVTSLRMITRTLPTHKGRSQTESYYVPVYEYYKGIDTIRDNEESSNLFSHYGVGEKITVLEKKINHENVSILSFESYYMTIPQLVILLLLIGILYGYTLTFTDNKKSN